MISWIVKLRKGQISEKDIPMSTQPAAPTPPANVGMNTIWNGFVNPDPTYDFSLQDADNLFGYSITNPGVIVSTLGPAASGQFDDQLYFLRLFQPLLEDRVPPIPAGPTPDNPAGPYVSPSNTSVGAPTRANKLNLFIAFKPSTPSSPIPSKWQPQAIANKPGYFSVNVAQVLAFLQSIKTAADWDTLVVPLFENTVPSSVLQDEVVVNKLAAIGNFQQS